MRWLLAQRWDDLLLAHWRVDPDELRRLLPARVEPDVYDGSAWVAIVAFVMNGSRPAGAPAFASLPPIPELNVRTYVRVGGVPGVWFLSLDASHRLFVNAGRALYGLHYRLARMAVANEGERVHYLSRCGPAAFAAAYEPCGEPEPARAGSLEHFLVERYRLFALRRGRLITATVDHEPWALQPAAARIRLNRMAPAGLELRGEPLLHFSRTLAARISTPELVQRATGTRVPVARTA
jgi:uncharacterized protein YqjF (DUF2071 family)